MNKQQLLKRLDDAWAALKEPYAGLTDSEMLEPGVVGEWSVKDILAHVTTWEEEALKALPLSHYRLHARAMRDWRQKSGR